MSSLIAFIEKKKSHLWASLAQVQRSIIQLLIFTVIIATYNQDDAFKFGLVWLTVLSGGFFLNLFFYTINNEASNNKSRQFLFVTSLNLSILGLLPTLYLYFHLFDKVKIAELILICLYSIFNSFSEYFFIAFNRVGKLAKLKKHEFIIRIFTTIICLAFIFLEFDIFLIMFLLLFAQIFSGIYLINELNQNFSLKQINKISIITLTLDNKKKILFQIIVSIILVMFSPVAIELLGETPEVILFSRLLLFTRNLISVGNRVNANISIERMITLVKNVIIFAACVAIVTLASFLYIKFILYSSINVFSLESLGLLTMLILSYLVELLGSRYKINN